MSLVNMKEMLAAARKARKAVGAFNITNYETAAAVLKAAGMLEMLIGRLEVWPMLLLFAPSTWRRRSSYR